MSKIHKLPIRLTGWDYWKIYFERVFGGTGNIAIKKRDKDYITFLSEDSSSVINKYNNIDTESILYGKIPKIIWTMWWQGEENLPEIPKECLRRMKLIQHNGGGGIL